jgi:DinB superfamily
MLAGPLDIPGLKGRTVYPTSIDWQLLDHGPDMTTRRTHILLVLLLVLSPKALHSQSTAGDETEAIRAYLLQAFQRNMELDLAYLDAAPDSMLRWAPTPGVRDFTQQLVHTTHNFFRPWRSEAPADADSVSYLNERDVLAARLTEGYEWALDRIRTMSADELSAPQTSAPAAGEPVWRLFIYWVEHAMWTRATTVPYLRIHGVAPPSVRFFG